ncbi:MAG: DeoR family transcriptional regulator [Candidatus Paceibacterota bacterium]
MPPEETKPADTPPPVQEVPSPVPESPVAESVPEPIPAPVEAVPMPPEAPAELKIAQPEPSFEQPQDKPTAQIPVNEPFDSLPQESGQATQGKPTPVSEPLPPSAPTSAISSVASFARTLAIKARAVIQSRKRKKLEKIMEVVNAKGKITNDQVEKLLHVSDATATRYLTQLEKEGKVQQVGKTGKSVQYKKI